MTEHRPDPDALLRRLAAEEPQGRGRLKVFFGASPGVGKTYSMLEAARGKRTAGLDVVSGWVETHGRAETERLAAGLESLPARQHEHRGAVLEEFDLDAALQRRPALLLLDELAHTNAPGSRHAKRWQDVQELLDAGIDVYTTLNVQHLESLNDVVGRVTGIQVRETVPDRIFDEADEIEFVDLPPEDLLRRMAEGKVYLADQASQAVRHFFRKGNLIALRELALRRTAERVDAQMQDYRRDHEIADVWPVAERILVCVRPNPASDKLVRAARRMAAQLRAEWIVACVESPSQPPLTEREREVLTATMKLAEQLGAETAVLSGPGVTATLVDFARQRNVSKIVLGKPAHSHWLDRLRGGSLLDALVRRSGGIDVYIISPEGEDQEPRPLLLGFRPRASRVQYLWAAIVVLLSTLICRTMFGRFDNSNLIMVYLLGVAFVAVSFGRGPSVLAACLSVGAFDFFFVPPFLTFAVTDTQYVITFGVMLGVGLLISTLAVRLRDQADAARRREERTQVLYGISRDLAGLRTSEEIARVAVHHASELCRGSAAVLRPAVDQRLAPAPGDPAPAGDTRELAVAQWAFDNGRQAGLGTDTLPGAVGLYLPIKGSRGALGVLAVWPQDASRPLSSDPLDLLETLARQLAAPLERAQLAREIEQAQLAAESERLRNTLLSSVSHDLRTPLAAITGAATSLQQEQELDPYVRQELTDTIAEESLRLNRLVTNLLDMTRLESGSVPLKREWHPLEEVVGSALARVEPLAGSRRIETALPADLPLVSIDPVLIEQVLVNLLENAFKYAGESSPVSIGARRTEDCVLVEVADQGPGLASGAEEQVFEKFFRGSSSQRGFGLGLAICRAIVSAHGGRIWAENQIPHGAAFRFTLPLGGAPPPPAPEG